MNLKLALIFAIIVLILFALPSLIKFGVISIITPNISNVLKFEGIEVIFAIAGLLAVAYLVLRQRK